MSCERPLAGRRSCGEPLARVDYNLKVSGAIFFSFLSRAIVEARGTQGGRCNLILIYIGNDDVFPELQMRCTVFKTLPSFAG